MKSMRSREIELQADDLSLEVDRISDSHLHLLATLRILSAQAPGIQSAQIVYHLQLGQDWTLVKGSRSGSSQVSFNRTDSYGNSEIVWNHQIQIALATTNPFGWPQICFYLVAPDAWGRLLTVAYGLAHLPVNPGLQIKTAGLFRPLPMSIFTGLLGYLKGNPAELKDWQRVLCDGKGRQVIRTRSMGQVKFQFDMSMVNLENMGFD